MLKSAVCVTLIFLLFGRSFAHEVPGDDASSSHRQSRNNSEENKFFSAYKPNYLIGSTNGGKNSSCDLKFQISLKQRLAPPLKKSVTIEDIDKDWRKRFYFGYTQRSFWDICRDSAPFRDSVYSPEIFHVTEKKYTDSSGVIKHRAKLQGGFKHASNGRDGNKSRSWNRMYGEVVYMYGHDLTRSWFGKNSQYGFEEGKTPKMSLGVTAWYIIDTGDENNDIEDYLGYGRAMVKYSTKGEQVNLSSWVGKKGKVSVESNLIIKTIPIMNKIASYIPFVGEFVGEALPSTDNTYFWHLQYFNGYGDELLEYDSREKVVRLGLLFTH